MFLRPDLVECDYSRHDVLIISPHITFENCLTISGGLQATLVCLWPTSNRNRFVASLASGIPFAAPSCNSRSSTPSFHIFLSHFRLSPEVMLWQLIDVNSSPNICLYVLLGFVYFRCVRWGWSEMKNRPLLVISNLRSFVRIIFERNQL